MGLSMGAGELPPKLLLYTLPRGRYVNHYDDTLAQLDALGHVAPFEAKARAIPAGACSPCLETALVLSCAPKLLFLGARGGR